ncbi:MAG: glycosyltransferase family 4 protein [Actinomycetota bacterium]|nr:glycosyltransferase family 4 protein [Actinomycetota bacterium]
MGAPRLALLGAFPYPLPQGSQVYFEDQARALTRAGCDCTLFTYGRGAGPPPEDLRVVTSPTATAPRRMRSGPSLDKPFADAALYRTYLEACRETRFDAVLAHHSEAAAIAIAARRFTRVPVVYVVHTLLAVELSTYLPEWATGGADALGGGIDRALARRADGLVALAHSAERALRAVARGPIAVIPPGLEPTTPPSREAIEAACARHGLTRDGYFLYSGNLDAYQELELLDAAAARLPAGAPPVVVATHAPVSDAERSAIGSLRVVQVDDFAEMRGLVFGARTLALLRRQLGGYPIKLLNYMEAGRAILAFAPVAEGLVHGESAWLLDFEAGPDAIADAIASLDTDAALRARLGEGARRRLATHHDPAARAEETLRFVDDVVGRCVSRAR